MNPFENYTTAAVAQENWEKKQGYSHTQPNQDVIPESDRARKELKLELLNLQDEYPDADYEKLFDELCQFARAHEYDYILDIDLDVVVDEIVSEVVGYE